MKIRKITTNRASVLIVSLLICLAGTIGFAALISLIANRGYYTELSELGIKRRLSTSNSKILLQEFLYKSPILEGLSTEIVLELPDSWGKITIPSFDSPLSSVQEFVLRNRLSPSGKAGYTRDVIATAFCHYSISADQTMGESRSIQVRMKSRSPIFSGTLLNIHQSIINPSNFPAVVGSVIVEGNTLVHGPTTGITGVNSGLQTTSMDAPDGLNGGSVLISNSPRIKRTMGFQGSAPTFQGEFNVIYNSANPLNSLYHKLIEGGAHRSISGGVLINIPGVSCCDEAGNGGPAVGGAGNVVTINISSHTLSPILIGNNVSKIKLIGQADASSIADADFLQPAFILVLQDTGSSQTLNNIVLEGSNNRRLLLGIKSSAGNTVDFTSNSSNSTPSWRMILYGENVSMRFTAAQEELVLIGGVHFDKTLESSSGDILRIRNELNPNLLERLAAREIWLETYLQ